MSTLILFLVIFAAIPANLFVLFYAVWSPWYESVAGWHLMTFTANLALILDFAILRRWLGDVPWLNATFVVLYALVGLQLYWRLGLLVRSHHRDLKNARELQPTEER